MSGVILRKAVQLARGKRGGLARRAKDTLVLWGCALLIRVCVLTGWWRRVEGAACAREDIRLTKLRENVSS